MKVQEALQKIRAPWVESVSRELASGEGVCMGFSEQPAGLQQIELYLRRGAWWYDMSWIARLRRSKIIRLNISHSIVYAHRTNNPNYAQIF